MPVGSGGGVDSVGVRGLRKLPVKIPHFKSLVTRKQAR